MVEEVISSNVGSITITYLPLLFTITIYYVLLCYVYYAKYIIKGEKDINIIQVLANIKKNHDYTILRQVFDMTRDGRWR